MFFLSYLVNLWRAQTYIIMCVNIKTDNKTEAICRAVPSAGYERTDLKSLKTIISDDRRL